MSDPDDTDALDAARFRYLGSRIVAVQHEDMIGMAVDTRDLEGINFLEPPTFRELIDSMMANSTKQNMRGH
jgi:hypothetical protein